MSAERASAPRLGGNTFIHHPGGTLVIAEKAQRCGGCGSMHFLFINRGGPTLCFACARDERDTSERGAES